MVAVPNFPNFRGYKTPKEVRQEYDKLAARSVQKQGVHYIRSILLPSRVITRTANNQPVTLHRPLLYGIIYLGQ